jgi:hypothetical protein
MIMEIFADSDMFMYIDEIDRNDIACVFGRGYLASACTASIALLACTAFPAPALRFWFCLGGSLCTMYMYVCDVRAGGSSGSCGRGARRTTASSSSTRKTSTASSCGWCRCVRLCGYLPIDTSHKRAIASSRAAVTSAERAV